MKYNFKAGDLVSCTNSFSQKMYGLILERCGYAHDPFYRVFFSYYGHPYTFREDELQKVGDDNNAK